MKQMFAFIFAVFALAAPAFAQERMGGNGKPTLVRRGGTVGSKPPTTVAPTQEQSTVQRPIRPRPDAPPNVIPARPVTYDKTEYYVLSTALADKAVIGKRIQSGIRRITQNSEAQVVHEDPMVPAVVRHISFDAGAVLTDSENRDTWVTTSERDIATVATDGLAQAVPNILRRTIRNGSREVQHRAGIDDRTQIFDYKILVKVDCDGYPVPYEGYVRYRIEAYQDPFSGAVIKKAFLKGDYEKGMKPIDPQLLKPDFQAQLQLLALSDAMEAADFKHWLVGNKVVFDRENESQRLSPPKAKRR